jgi:hypothetical protein
VLAFARSPDPAAEDRPAGFSMRDRIELQAWLGRAAAAGISRVRLEPAEPVASPGMGEFLLIYRNGNGWADIAVAPLADGRVEVWCMRDGATLGIHADLRSALGAIAGP